LNKFKSELRSILTLSSFFCRAVSTYKNNKNRCCLYHVIIFFFKFAPCWLQWGKI